MENQAQKWVIESVRLDGKRFRPSDWIERISANMGSFGADHRLHYSKSVYPCVVDGEKCLMVDGRLKVEDPIGYEYIMSFARINGLRSHPLDG
ncbi:MAG: DUF3579 domain-containing protein [Gammaproteobacteria bacterium]|nr:DUF3579 domain-containing protein [Gammaproteobacteria bacterium]